MLSFGSAGLASPEWGGAGEVNLLLGFGTDHELRSVDEIFADLDVAVIDEATGVVDRLGLASLLVNSGLQSALHELVEGQTQNVIQLALAVTEQAISGHSAEQGSTFEESLGILLLKSEQLSGSLSDFGEGKLHSPDFSLVCEAELADLDEFTIEPLLLVGSPWCFEGLGV